MSGSEPRFSPLTVETLNAAQRPVAERLLKLLPNGLGGPFPIMLKSPGMATSMIDLFEHYRFNSTLETRLRELATLVVAREWTAQFEWWAHAPLAAKAGLSDAAIADLRQGKRPIALKDDEAVVYDLVVALLRDHGVGDALFAKAKALLGEERLVDLVSLVGEYVKVSMILNIGQVGIPNSGAPPLAPLAKDGAR